MTTSGGLAFGVYDGFSTAPLDSQIMLKVTCPKTLAPRALLSQGSAPSFIPRTMRNGTDILSYNVFLDAGMSIVWGDGTGGTSAWDGPSGSSTLNAFGRIPASQDAEVGNYADALTVTVLF